MSTSHWERRKRSRTLRYFLSSIDLRNLLVQQLVTLLADGNNLLASYTQRGDGLEHLLGDLSSALVFGKGIGVGKSVVYAPRISTSLWELFDLVVTEKEQTRGR